MEARTSQPFSCHSERKSTKCCPTLPASPQHCSTTTSPQNAELVHRPGPKPPRLVCFSVQACPFGIASHAPLVLFPLSACEHRIVTVEAWSIQSRVGLQLSVPPTSFWQSWHPFWRNEKSKGMANDPVLLQSTCCPKRETARCKDASQRAPLLFGLFGLWVCSFFFLCFFLFCTSYSTLSVRSLSVSRPVFCNQRTGHSVLCCSPLCRMELALFACPTRHTTTGPSS